MKKFFLDYVHNNPGEEPFETRFNEPSVLKEYGFNGQVFKDLNLLATYPQIERGLFPQSDEEIAWYRAFEDKVIGQNIAAKKEGLMVFYQLDPLIFPKKLVEKFSGQFRFEGKNISAEREFIFELYSNMFDEICGRFKDVDGYIIRVGETYLFDSNHHLGGVPVKWLKEQIDIDRSPEIESYVELINYLRGLLCEKHGKTLIFRSWDCFHDRMHSNSDYYLNIVEQVEPHDDLYFSIKHTVRDFWRYMEFNPSLNKGPHSQLIEIQSQREYEGKGAFANYSAGGVIRGFEEMENAFGIADIYDSEKIAGIFHWSRGGGWHGPYLKNEFWCDFNTTVIAEFVKTPTEPEDKIFASVCRDHYKMKGDDAGIFREICMLSEEAVLKSIYCAVYDRKFHDSRLPSNLWFRDDRIEGLEQLRPVFDYLFDKGKVEEALAEKQQAVEIWKQMRRLFESASEEFKEEYKYVGVSIDYGLRLFEWTYRGWELMAEGFTAEKNNREPGRSMAELVEEYDKAYQQYCEIEKQPACATLFNPVSWAWPGETAKNGLGETVKRFRA